MRPGDDFAFEAGASVGLAALGVALGDAAAPLGRAGDVELHGVQRRRHAPALGVHRLDVDQGDVGAVGLPAVRTHVRRQAQGHRPDRWSRASVVETDLAGGVASDRAQVPGAQATALKVNRKPSDFTPLPSDLPFSSSSTLSALETTSTSLTVPGRSSSGR
jgi:hypothetical protein